MRCRRFIPLMYLVSLILFVVGLFFHVNAFSQELSRCDTLEHDRPILERVIEQQDEQIATRGRSIALLKIRVGLSDSTANAIRIEANKRIVSLTQQRDTQQARAEKAEAGQPKTGIGRLWQNVKLNFFAPVGIGTVVLSGGYIALKSFF